jgi:2-polyprenyl-3-methyl-5-hydroxy-6-metoxy-1,4-benzoquinol methylase
MIPEGPPALPSQLPFEARGAVISPVTLKPNVEPIEEFSSQRIIDLYREQLKLDVRRCFRGMDKVLLCRCKDSLYRFFYPAIVGDESFYLDLQKTGTYYRDWNWENEVAASYLRPDHALLEVGCGLGAFLERVRSQCASVSAIEFNPGLIELVRQKGIPIFNQSIQEHAKSHQDQYDVICAFQVLEHVPEVNAFMTGALSCLKKGGNLIFSVPNSDPYYYKYDKYHVLNLPPHHVGLWNKVALANLSKVFDVEVEPVRVEPQFALKQQLLVIGRHRQNAALVRLAELIPPLVEKVLVRTLGRFIPGRNLVAVFTKR